MWLSRTVRSAHLRMTNSLRSNSTSIVGGRADENLLDDGRARARHRPERAFVHAHVAPADEPLPGAEDLVFEDVHAATAVVFVARQKHTADAVLAGLRQLDVARLALATEERIRQLNQDAGAVARQRIAAAGAAMHEVQKDIDSLFDDVVRRLCRRCWRRSRRHRSRARREGRRVLDVEVGACRVRTAGVG